MAIEYLGLSEINGPLVVLEGVQNGAYDEIVEMTVGGNVQKIGRIIEIYGDKAIIQVLRGIPWKFRYRRKCWAEPSMVSDSL